MAQIIRLKRSTTSGSKPTISSLETGEIAVNVYDGKAFIRKSGSVDEVNELVSTNTETAIAGNINIDGSITASYFSGDGSQLTNITVDQAATVQKAFSKSSTWVINHNFNTRNAIAQVFDTDGYQVIPQTLRHTNSNTVTITFESPRSGYAVVARGGHIVSGSIAANSVEGLDTAITNQANLLGLFSGSAQITMSGDVTGTAAGTIISQIDGGSI